MITTTDGLLAALTASTKQTLSFYKISVTAEGGGTFHSMWRVGGLPGAAALPATGVGANPTSATAGAIPIVNAAGGNELNLAYFAVASGVVGTWRLYDRLWHNSGLSGTSVVSQSVNSTAWTRGDLTGAGVELWLEFYTAIGATGATLTVTYTNQDGTAGRTGTYVHPANAEALGQMVPVTLQSGDTGVRSVQSVQWSGTTGGAGDFGLVLLRQISELPAPSIGAAFQRDAINLGLPSIPNDACLAIQVACSTTSTGLMVGMFQIVESAT